MQLSEQDSAFYDLRHIPGEMIDRWICHVAYRPYDEILGWIEKKKLLAHFDGPLFSRPIKFTLKIGETVALETSDAETARLAFNRTEPVATHLRALYS